MVEIIQAPNEYLCEDKDTVTVFLAGGISNCPKWQDIIVERLKTETLLEGINVVVYNPRCEYIPNEDEQVTWEYERLEASEILLFWFAKGSMNPITLFEYGNYVNRDVKLLVVGCDEEYPRKSNVQIQTKLRIGEHFNMAENLDSLYDMLVGTIFATSKQKKDWNKLYI